MAEVTLHLGDPVVCGRAKVRALVRQEATGGRLGGGLWFAARKEPVAVLVEIDGTETLFRLSPARTGSDLGIDLPS